MSEEFTFFWNGPFSQWKPAEFTCYGQTFNCAEQFMMFYKAVFFDDYDIAGKIMETVLPSEQKKLGRKVKDFDVDKWGVAAKHIVYAGSFHKYTQNPELFLQLVNTHSTTLVEASPYDKIWGIGLHDEDPRAFSRDTWQGLNWLGEVLTELRGDLMEGQGIDIANAGVSGLRVPND